ncbi:MAG TPA: ATP-binding protein [Phycisphaerae bacterium]|nr:response regulator [Phycisphaerales bacterium]HRX86035.1 ATP-binding protein [Phycisphaerae bacterium]
MARALRADTPTAPQPEILRPPYGLFAAAVLGTLLVLAALLTSQLLLGMHAGRIHNQTLTSEQLVNRIAHLDDNLAGLIWSNAADTDGKSVEDYNQRRLELAGAIEQLLALTRAVSDESQADDLRSKYVIVADAEDRAFKSNRAGDPELAITLLGSARYRQAHAALHRGLGSLHEGQRTQIAKQHARLTRWQTGLAAAAVIGVGIIAGAWADAFRRLRRYEARSREAVNSVTESERRLRDLQHILRLAIDSMPQSLFWKDQESRFLGCNEALARDAGLASPNDIVGLTDADLPWSDIAADNVADDRAVMESGLSRVGIEEPHVDSAGRTRWMRVSKVPLRDHSGQIIGVMGTFEDVTRERETKEELKRAKEEAELASRSKSAFLANMSHEIRTPMTAILGFADLLCDPALDAQQRAEHVDTIRRNGEHLLALINDILDLSKIEAGRLEVETIRCNPAEIVNDVFALMRGRAAAKNLPFDVEFTSQLPQHIDSDPTRIRQILVNLVGNAIKFTEMGTVRLVVQCRAEENRHILSFDVVDSGIGMTRAQIVRLFRPFVQADTSTRRMFGGTGLGLAISKRLAEMLGGALTVSSAPRAGSTFRLTLKLNVPAEVPWHQPAAGAATQHHAPCAPCANDAQPLVGVRILLAEDGPDNRRLITHVLNRAGAELRVVENGRDAADFALTAAEAGQPYHVILMDMQMPILDGYDATRLLRSRGYRGPIIALTAHAMSSDRAVCLDAGCNDYATKPIKRKELFATIHKWLESHTPAASTIA